jgi:hypothetical protein
MLDPDHRQLYVEALRPPVGYRLCEAIGTTYSLDMTTLLGVPIALVLSHLDVRKLGAESAVTMLEALRRCSTKLTVFCDRGRIAAPSGQHVLYPLLERVIVEVQAPGGGSLHSKLWLLSYERDEETGEGDELVMRLVILSRNLTADRSWDVSLCLDGRLTGRNRTANRPLSELLEALPGLATNGIGADAKARVDRMSEQARRTEWELPPGFEDLQFHVLGLSRKSTQWLPEGSDRLLVISPFVSDTALALLAETSSEPVALISRAEELDRLEPATRAKFEKIFVMSDRAESEDGEDTAASSERSLNALLGLHAKVYIAKRGWDTRVYLGSANATHAALLNGSNIELLAELVGKTSKIPGKGIDGVLDAHGLGALLVPYTPSAVSAEQLELEAAERALDRVRIAIASAELNVRFERGAEGSEDFVPWLSGPRSFELAGVSSFRAWLVTVDASNARDGAALAAGERVPLAPCISASATGLVAFELVAARADVRSTFVLNLPVASLPEDRDAQVVRLVINNRERFFAFLLALLQSFDADALSGLPPADADTRGAWGAGNAGHGLLEQLVRARARDPRRLTELRAIISALQATAEGRAIVPADFMEVWNAVAEEGLR